MTRAARTSRWARRFVFTGTVFLVGWQLTLLAGAGRRPGLLVGLLGFVFHTIFGKAYSLLPSYFDRELATTRLLGPHLLCSTTGVAALAVGLERDTALLETVGGALWLSGVVIFLGTLVWTVRDNPTGAETGTGEHNAHRERLDRLANRFLLVALAYLLAGSYELFAVNTAAPSLFDGYPPRAVHLLAAGAGGLFVLGVGFRLLPRFFATTAPRSLAAGVLAAGAVGPAVIATTLPAGDWLPVGAVLEAAAVVGFALTVGILFARTDRDRVGFYGVLAAAVAGLAGVTLGLLFAFDGLSAARIGAHTRLNVLGFLGLTIVGVTYQFYPPAVGSFPGGSDRTALGIIVVLLVSLLVEAHGTLTGSHLLVTVGRVGSLVGTTAHLSLLGGLFRQRGR